jgi:hypothetical protein
MTVLGPLCQRRLRPESCRPPNELLIPTGMKANQCLLPNDCGARYEPDNLGAFEMRGWAYYLLAEHEVAKQHWASCIKVGEHGLRVLGNQARPHTNIRHIFTLIASPMCAVAELSDAT